MVLGVNIECCEQIEDEFHTKWPRKYCQKRLETFAKALCPNDQCFQSVEDTMMALQRSILTTTVYINKDVSKTTLFILLTMQEPVVRKETSANAIDRSKVYCKGKQKFSVHKIFASFDGNL